MEVKVLDVPGILRSDHFHTILTVAFLMEVDSVEFALELSADIFEEEVLIDSNETPMAHMDRLGGLG